MKITWIEISLVVAVVALLFMTHQCSKEISSIIDKYNQCEEYGLLHNAETKIIGTDKCYVLIDGQWQLMSGESNE